MLKDRRGHCSEVTNVGTEWALVNQGSLAAMEDVFLSKEKVIRWCFLPKDLILCHPRPPSTSWESGIWALAPSEALGTDMHVLMVLMSSRIAMFRALENCAWNAR